MSYLVADITKHFCLRDKSTMWSQKEQSTGGTTCTVQEPEALFDAEQSLISTVSSFLFFSAFILEE